MAGFFGNSMFGHNFQATAFQQNHGGSTSGFGNSDKKAKDVNSFGKNGMANSHDMAGGMHGHGGGAIGFQRQNSMLSEMTRSKADKGGNPWLYVHTPGHVENGHVVSLYEKPLETEKKKPSLQKQSTIGEYTGLPRRAPSFASDPERMRSRTVSTSSAPGGPGRMPLQRGVSICDEPDEPLNMDRARPVLRRAQTIAAGKERRRSEAALKPKKPLLPLHLPKFRRKSTSSKHSADLETPSNSVTATPQRSRSGTTDSKRASTDNPPAPNRDLSQSKASVNSNPSSENKFKDDEDPEQAKLILSLLSPETEDVFETQSPDINSYPTEEPEALPVYSRRPQSPTIVSKKIHEYLPPQPNRPHTQSPKVAKPTRPYPGKSFLDFEPTDSESSETYYDCLPQEENRKAKKKVPRRKRGNSNSTGTDGEDTTSTKSDTPMYTTTPAYYNTDTYSADPKMPYESINGKGHYSDYQYEAETLPIRHIPIKPEPIAVPVYSQPMRTQPSVKTYMYKHPSPNVTISVPNQTVIKLSPKYETDLKAEIEGKDGNDTNTADSSESGYATSHKPLSPKDCDIKVLNFVNSLPNHSDMEEEHSDDNHHGVINGSDTETDTEDPIPPISNLSNTKCVSGSETDASSLGSNGTSSKLEVMKLLDSPSEVAARVENTLRASNRKLDDDSIRSSTRRLDDESIRSSTRRLDDDSTRSSTRRLDDNSSTSNRKPSVSSQTEVLQVYKKEANDEPDNVAEKFIKLHETPVEANCVVVESKQTGSPLESPNTETRILKPSHKSNYSFFDKPMLSFRSTNSYQNLSRCTQFMDLVLSCLNVVLFLTSAAVIAGGLWLLLKNFNVNEMTEILGNNLLQVIIYLSIGGAGAAMLAAFCLCCGVRQDKTGLGFYAFVLVIVIFAFATAAVLSAMFADKLGGIEFKVNFRERLVTKYGVNNAKETQFFTEAWDKMHQEFECCGVEGNENDTSSWAIFKKFSLWFREQPYKATVFVPESCCRKNANTEVCQGSDHNLLGPPVYGPPMDRYYPQKNSNLNTNGCYELFTRHATMVVAWTALITGGLAGLYFIVVMLTWVFCFKKSKEDTESYYEDSYYDMEVHNDVFEESDRTHLRQRGPNESAEETLLLQQPPITVHRVTQENFTTNETSATSAANAKPDSKVKPDTKLPVIVTTDVTTDEDKRDNRDNNKSDGEDSEEGEDTNTDCDSEDDGLVAQTDDGIRRNMWLSSEARAVHLLSVAITEEDSNYEDSDEEPEKQQTTAFV